MLKKVVNTILKTFGSEGLDKAVAAEIQQEDPENAEEILKEYWCEDCNMMVEKECE